MSGKVRAVSTAGRASAHSLQIAIKYGGQDRPSKVIEAVRQRGTRETTSNGRGVRAMEDQLLSRCWCDRRDVVVAKSDVRAGRTISCGRADCNEGALVS